MINIHLHMVQVKHKLQNILQHPRFSIPDFLAVLCPPPAPGLPGEPVFLLNRLLKKLANTPSLAALSKQKKNTHYSDRNRMSGYRHFWIQDGNLRVEKTHYFRL